jgi:hypothetical protein
MKSDFVEAVMSTESCETGRLARPGLGSGELYSARRARPRRAGLPVCLLTFAVGLASCSQAVETTPEQQACIGRKYSSYDAKKLNQCVDVCRVCMKGNTVTCNTSCRLRGAT